MYLENIYRLILNVKLIKEEEEEEERWWLYLLQLDNSFVIPKYVENLALRKPHFIGDVQFGIYITIKLDIEIYLTVNWVSVQTL